MKAIEFIKRELPLWIIMLAPIIYMFIVWDRLPDKLPIHWNLKGEIDNYGSKLIFPFFMVGIYILMLLTPLIDPKRYNYKYFSKVYYIIRLVLLAFFCIINFVVIFSSLGIKLNIERIIVSGMFVLFIILGNYMGNIKHNWFVGIKTPWTLSDETVWKKTHFLAGRLWFWGSLGGLGLSFLFTGKGLFIFFIIIVFMLSFIPIIYSYLIFRIRNKSDI